MNCEKCQDLLGDFFDGTLEGDAQRLLSTHLEECLCCADVRQELQSIARVAREECSAHSFAPPNERALWLRIRNSIEADLDAERVRVRAAAQRAQEASESRGLWARLMGKRWELSLPQLTAAIFALVIGVSVVTALGLQGLRGGALPAGSSISRSFVPGDGSIDASADRLYHQTYLQQQQVRINIWEQRVEQQKASWNPQMRNAFERSLNVIDAAVNDSLRELEHDPHNEVSAEMLNAALDDKVELLREFSEQ